MFCGHRILSTIVGVVFECQLYWMSSEHYFGKALKGINSMVGFKYWLGGGTCVNLFIFGSFHGVD